MTNVYQTLRDDIKDIDGFILYILSGEIERYFYGVVGIVGVIILWLTLVIVYFTSQVVCYPNRFLQMPNYKYDELIGAIKNKEEILMTRTKQVTVRDLFEEK